MHILPDIHFVKNFRRHYAENYEKIQTKMSESAEKRRARAKAGPEIIKYGLAGLLAGLGATAVIIGIAIAIGSIAMHGVASKHQTVQELKRQISDTSYQIAAYKAINGDEMKEQVNNAAAWITHLQNQYITRQFEDNFDAYAARYLGKYNSDWAEGLTPESPVWRGYINYAAGFDAEANLIFILYDNDLPMLIADTKFSLDQSGNLGALKSVGKLWLI